LSIGIVKNKFVLYSLRDIRLVESPLVAPRERLDLVQDPDRVRTLDERAP